MKKLILFVTLVILLVSPRILFSKQNNDSKLRELILKFHQKYSKRKNVPIKIAEERVKTHLAKDLNIVKKQYPSLSSNKLHVLAMMLYQGISIKGDFPAAHKLLVAAMKTNKDSDWVKVQKEMLDSKWAKYQTPARALEMVQAFHPSTSKTILKNYVAH